LEKDTQADNGITYSNKAAAALILKIQERDASALAALYESTGRLLFGLILKVLGNRAPAEEVLLDTYTHIWNQAASFDPGRSSLEWILSIARTRAIARLHGIKRDRKKREFSQAGPDSKMTVAPELQKLVRSSIESLMPAQQEVLTWIYYSGLSCSDIAAQITKPIGAVRTHTRLGLSKLSEMVRPLFENGTETTGVALKHEAATEEVRELAAFYALGVLTQHEARAFEAHLMEGCSVCKSELQKFEQTAAAIGLGSEEAETPEYVRDLLLARIERKPQVPISAKPPHINERKPMTEPESPLFSSLSKPESRKSMSKTTFWILQALMIALVLLCCWAFYYLRSMQSSNSRLSNELSKAQDDANSLQILLDIQKEKSDKLNQLLAVVTKPGVRIARLAGQSASSGAIIFDPQQHQCLVMGSFPPPPPGKAYQLWFATSSAKMSAGLIKVHPANPTYAEMPVPAIASEAVAAGITLEPDSGSTAPTTPFIVAGRFN